MSETNPICPYCKSSLESIPTTKKKCPSCNQPIYSRTSPYTKQKVLLRQDELESFENQRQQWLKETSLKSSRDEILREVGRYGITVNDFEQVERKLAQKLGSQPSLQDVAWEIYNQTALEKAKAENTNGLSQLYFQMALFADKTGRDPFELLKQSQYWKLIEYQNSGLAKQLGYGVRISTAPDSCAACKTQNKNFYSIELALTEMPLPHNQCSFELEGKPGFCRCEYLLERKPEPEQTRTPTAKISQKSQSPSFWKIIGLIILGVIALCCICSIFSIILSSFSK